MQLKEREKNLKTSRALPTHVCLQNCPGFPRCHRVVTLFTAPATRVSHCSHTFQATSVKLFQLSRRRKVSQQGTPINFPLATRSNYPSRPCVRLVSFSGQMVKTSFCIFLYRLMQLTVNNSKYWQSHCCCQLQSPARQLFLLGSQFMRFWKVIAADGFCHLCENFPRLQIHRPVLFRTSINQRSVELLLENYSCYQQSGGQSPN